MQQLTVQQREIFGSKLNRLRKAGIIPANIYNRGNKSTAIQIDNKIFTKLFNEVGQSSVIDLHVEGSQVKHPCFVADVQLDPITDKFIHVDFRQVNLKEKVTLNVPVEFIGESQAVADGAMLVTVLEEVELEGLPTDMPEHVTVDITKLVTTEDVVTVSDLQFDRSKLTITLEADTPVARAEIAEMEEIVEEIATPEEPEIITETEREESKAEQEFENSEN